MLLLSRSNVLCWWCCRLIDHVLVSMSVVVLPTRCRLTDMMLVEIDIMLPTRCWFTDTVSVVRHGVGLPTLGQSGSNISKRRMNDLADVTWKLRIFERILYFDLSTTL